MIKVLDGLTKDDIVLLHGCCHNPTGANLTPAQWDRVVESLKKTGAFPLIDLAYLGFGDGLEQDAYGVRKVASSVPEKHDRLLGQQEFRPLSRAHRRRHRHRQGFGHGRRRVEPDAEHHPRHDLADPRPRR